MSKVFRKGHGNTAQKRSKLPYVTLRHGLRGLSLALFIAACTPSPWQRPNALSLGYAFSLGLIREIASGETRKLLLQQTNVVEFCIFIFAVVAEGLPLIVIGATYRPDARTASATFSLFCCICFSIASPREWIPPPESKGLDGISAKPTNEETCSWLDSFCAYSRVGGLIRKGWTNSISMRD